MTPRNDEALLLESENSTKNYGTSETHKHTYKKQATLSVSRIRQRLQRVEDRQKHDCAQKVGWGLIFFGMLAGVWAGYIVVLVILNKYFYGDRFLSDYQYTKVNGVYCKSLAPLTKVCDWPDSYNATTLEKCFDRAAKLCDSKKNAWWDDPYSDSQFNFTMGAIAVGVGLCFITMLLIIYLRKRIIEPTAIDLPELEKGQVKKELPNLNDDVELSDVKRQLTSKLQVEEGKAARMLSFFDTDADTPVAKFLNHDASLDCTRSIFQYSSLKN